MEEASTIELSTAKEEPQRTHVGNSVGKLVWDFLVMSFLGLVGETIQHLVAFGEWESRAGFIWGPFSPIYGTAAVLLTIILEPFQRRSLPLIIIVGAIVGGGLEYFASWAMETFGGIVAWSYLDVPFNIDGRTDLFHALLWGSLGAIWVRIGLPLCEKVFSHVNLKSKLYRIITVGLTIFVILDIVMTIVVLLRADARTHDIPPQNALEQFCDDVYPTEYLQQRFHNMGGLGI